MAAPREAYLRGPSPNSPLRGSNSGGPKRTTEIGLSQGYALASAARQTSDQVRTKALNPRERLDLATHNFRYWFESAGDFYRGAGYYAGRGLRSHG